ncbi:MAG: hypothetical protein ACK5CA_15355 [Cyanobacteriota bacterium]|jgi:putative Mn2+ efflux pump MntP
MWIGKLLMKILPPVIIGGVIFVGVGDKFLPQPLKSASADTREQINKALLQMMPKPKLKRPSEKRENQVEQLTGPQ